MAKSDAMRTTARVNDHVDTIRPGWRHSGKKIEPPSSHPDGSKSFLGGRSQACVPPLPCLRPYHVRVNLIWMEECDLANTARIFQSRLSKPSCSSNARRVHLISFHISLLLMALYLYS
jgi:hypothetical protein